MESYLIEVGGSRADDHTEWVESLYNSMPLMLSSAARELESLKRELKMRKKWEKRHEAELEEAREAAERRGYECGRQSLQCGPQCGDPYTGCDWE